MGDLDRMSHQPRGRALRSREGSTAPVLRLVPPHPPPLPAGSYAPVAADLYRIDIADPDAFAAYEFTGHCFVAELGSINPYYHVLARIDEVYGWVEDGCLIGTLALRTREVPRPRVVWVWLHPRYRGSWRFAKAWRSLVDVRGRLDGKGPLTLATALVLARMQGRYRPGNAAELGLGEPNTKLLSLGAVWRKT